MEFVRKWIRLNTPTKTTSPRLLHADSGQFMFENGRITAMLDFEFAVLGDPIHDLAALRSRAIGQPMGDLRPLFDRYRELTGTKISRELLGFYSVSWRIVTALNTANSLVTPQNRSDHYLEYICRYISSLLNTLRDIAEIENISFEEPAAISDSPSRWALSFSLYEDRLDELGKSAPAQEEKYQLFRTKAFVTFTSRLNQHGHFIEAEYMSSVNQLANGAAKTWEEADALLETFLETASPEQDRRVLQIIYTWIRRQASLLEGLVRYHQLTVPYQPLSELCD
jgi:hypothetical protein